MPRTALNYTHFKTLPELKQMGTRSTIAVALKTGKVLSVYCHWDGYLSHNGKLLTDHYNTQEKAEALVSLGDISSLGERIAPAPNEAHTFNHTADGVTVYYGRDRGDDYVDPIEYVDVTDYYYHLDGNEYDYLFIDGEWLVRYHSTKQTWVPLGPALTMDLLK